MGIPQLSPVLSVKHPPGQPTGPTGNDADAPWHAHMELVAGGVNGVTGPNLMITGLNVQIKDHTGATDSTSGLGNLIIGHNEPSTMPPDRTGSHNLVVGGHHSFSSHGGLVAGQLLRP